MCHEKREREHVTTHVRENPSLFKTKNIQQDTDLSNLRWTVDEEDDLTGITKGVLVGDAATRIKQTLMFDLPVIDREEVQALMKADAFGGGRRTAR